MDINSLSGSASHGANLTVETDGPEGTIGLGIKLAPMLRTGDVLALWGDFGSGKTTFVQGVGRGIGVRHPVVSPSFGLLNVYRSDEDGLPIYHVDLYRITSFAEAEGFGIEDIIDGDGVTLIEWPGIIEPILPADRLDLNFEMMGEQCRRIHLRASGARFVELLEQLAEDGG